MAMPTRRSTLSGVDGAPLRAVPKLEKVNSVQRLNGALAKLTLASPITGKLSPGHLRTGSMIATPGRVPSQSQPRLAASDSSLDKKGAEAQAEELFLFYARSNFAPVSREAIMSYTPEERSYLVKRLEDFFKVLEDPSTSTNPNGCEAALRDAAKRDKISALLKEIEKTRRTIRHRDLLEQIEAKDPEVRELLVVTNPSVIDTKELFKLIKRAHRDSAVSNERRQMHVSFCKNWMQANGSTAIAAAAEKSIRSCFRRLAETQIGPTARPLLPELPQKEELFDFQKLLETVLGLGLKGDCSAQVEQVASDLFLFQKTLYSLFTEHDLVACKWPQDAASKAKSSPLLKLYADFYNKLCFFIVSLVLNTKNETDRAVLIRFFANVAITAKEKGDLASMVSIHNAVISHTAITRLHSTWKHLTSGSIEKNKTKLAKLCAPIDKFSALRLYCEELSESQIYHIPLFTGCLGELDMLEERVSSVLENGEAYNIAKMRQVRAKIATVLLPQRWQPKANVPQFLATNLIQRYLKDFQADEEALYALSRLVEPPPVVQENGGKASS